MTNLDNDGLVGDSGEAYLSLVYPAQLEVDHNLSGLDFGAGFNLVFSAQSRHASEPGHLSE